MLKWFTGWMWNNRMFYLQCALLYWYMVVFRFSGRNVLTGTLVSRHLMLETFQEKPYSLKSLRKKKHRVGAVATNFPHLRGQHAFMPTINSLRSFQCIVIRDGGMLRMDLRGLFKCAFSELVSNRYRLQIRLRLFFMKINSFCNSVFSNHE